jgi:DNA-binding beta-propeller fold protein YncE
MEPAMERTENGRRGVAPFFWIIPLVLAFSLAPAALKVRVTSDNASIKATPEIGGKTLATVPLNTVLDAETKQGEWYKVTLSIEGVQISGFIHEVLVQEVGQGEAEPVPAPAGISKSQDEIAAEIGIKLEENRNMIRQGSDLEPALDGLWTLVAKAFALDDHKKQKQVASEIYYWLGLAYAKKGDNYNALKQFKTMFEVDYSHAKEITRNIYEPVVSGFIDLAEKQYRGLLVDYSLEIVTEPKEAAIKIDGKQIGLSPEVYRTTVPKFTLAIEKEGYKTVKEDVFLSQPTTRKEISLQSLGRAIVLSSIPSGAKVYLDGQDSGKTTNCELPYVPYGERKIRLEKEKYAGWERTIQLLEGPEPFPLEAVLIANSYIPYQRLGGPESKIYKAPRAIMIDKNGNTYVLDETDAKVRKFDPQGRFISGWGDMGREFRVLKEAAGIATDNQGFFYITDSRNGCVAKFAADGKFVSKWGETGTKPDEFDAPQGIAIDGDQYIYVADSGNNRIKKYSSQGSLVKIWGQAGTGAGEFAGPTGIAVNQKKEIFVVDRVHIQKFSPEGELILAWGKPGSKEGELGQPMGLAIDAQGAVYVADAGNDKILKFDSDGRFVVEWGTPGTGEGQMMSPCGVAVNDKGSVFVAERANNRIQEFRIAS